MLNGQVLEYETLSTKPVTIHELKHPLAVYPQDKCQQYRLEYIQHYWGDVLASTFSILPVSCILLYMHVELTRIMGNVLAKPCSFYSNFHNLCVV